MVRNALVASIALALAFAAPSPARAGDARHAVLVDQAGSRFRIADLAGRPVVITFVASRCADACPIANAQFARLESLLAKEGVRATLLTVTLDPAFDSPFVMARTARAYAATAQRWRFASGSVASVRAVMATFGVEATANGKGAPEEHSSFVYVLDGRGRLARTLLLSSNLPDDVAALFHGSNAIR
jgi:protein SCO1/2